jgi:integrase
MAQAQAEAVLKAAEQAPARMRAYIIVSLLTGARTEEMRALRWHDVDLAGQPDVSIPPNVALVRSVRARGRYEDQEVTTRVDTSAASR